MDRQNNDDELNKTDYDSFRTSPENDDFNSEQNTGYTPYADNYSYDSQNGYQYNSYEADYIQKQNQLREIKRVGLLTGAALLMFILIQNLVALLLIPFNLMETYLNNGVFQIGFDIIVTVLAMYLPFMLFGKKIQRYTKTEDCTPLNKPKDTDLAILAVPAGLGICMAANFATNFIVIFMQIIGVQLSSPELAQPKGIFGFLLTVVRVVITAAVVEEICFRGYVMQPLIKYGEKFAIVMAALTFGLMHGNLVQAPFALIAGIGLGYITVKTGSLWPSIVTHALNNLLTTVLDYVLSSGIDKAVVNIIYNVSVYGIFIVGMLCFVIFRFRTRQKRPFYAWMESPTMGQKVKAYLLNPTMIIAIGYMIYCTTQFVKSAS